MKTSKKEFQSPVSLILYSRIVALLFLLILLISCFFSLNFHKHVFSLILCGGLPLLIAVLVEKTSVHGLLSNKSGSIPHTKFIVQKLRSQKRLFRFSILKLSPIGARFNINLIQPGHFDKNIHFNNTHEVLSESTQIKSRSNDLYLAHLLFQKSKKEVTLVFYFMGFKRRIKTSIRHIGIDHIVINEGLLLSISSVYKVEF
jgi:uncharacterized membrane protein